MIAYENLYTSNKRILEWAQDRNLIFGSTPKDQLCKLAQEVGEMSDAICKQDIMNLIEEIGDVYVVLNILCEMHDISIPECAEAAYNKIKDRKGVMYNGVFIKETDPEYEQIVKEL